MHAHAQHVIAKLICIKINNYFTMYMYIGIVFFDSVTLRSTLGKHYFVLKLYCTLLIISFCIIYYYLDTVHNGDDITLGAYYEY